MKGAANEPVAGETCSMEPILAWFFSLMLNLNIGQYRVFLLIESGQILLSPMMCSRIWGVSACFSSEERRKQRPLSITFFPCFVNSCLSSYWSPFASATNRTKWSCVSPAKPTVWVTNDILFTHTVRDWKVTWFSPKLCTGTETGAALAFYMRRAGIRRDWQRLFDVGQHDSAPDSIISSSGLLAFLMWRAGIRAVWRQDLRLARLCVTADPREKRKPGCLPASELRHTLLPSSLLLTTVTPSHGPFAAWDRIRVRGRPVHSGSEMKLYLPLVQVHINYFVFTHHFLLSYMTQIYRSDHSIYPALLWHFFTGLGALLKVPKENCGTEAYPGESWIKYLLMIQLLEFLHNTAELQLVMKTVPHSNWTWKALLSP